MPFNPSSVELNSDLNAELYSDLSFDHGSGDLRAETESAATADLDQEFNPDLTDPNLRSNRDSTSNPAANRLALPQPSDLPLEDTYLKFRLESNVPAAIAVRSVQEAFILPARQLTTMPNMPAALLGLTNRRNQVVWVLDLAQLLGISIFDATVQQFSLLLIQVGMVKIGLAVQRIEGMVRLAPDVIQAPIGQMSLSLLPYLQGCALQQQEDHQEILLLLDAEAIVQAPLMKYPFV